MFDKNFERSKYTQGYLPKGIHMYALISKKYIGRVCEREEIRGRAQAKNITKKSGNRK